MTEKEQGFTLIELLIVIAILAIISGIAYPSYQDHVIKTRRTDAQAELIKAQIKQSSHHIINPSYISSPASAGLPTNNQHYRFTIEHASANAYTMKAIVKESSGTQNNDKSDCKALYIDQDNNKTSDGNLNNITCWVN